MRLLLLSTAYLPPVEYVAQMLAHDRILVEQHDHYLKQTYRNRCTIAGPEGKLSLTVPIVRPNPRDCPMHLIRISEHGHWRHLHWNALASAYGHSPFFEYYEDDFRPLYEQPYEFLMDFNEALLHTVCRLIPFTPCLERTTRYLPAPAIGTERARTGTEPLAKADTLLDLRDRIHPKHAEGQASHGFRPVAYHQVFQNRLGFLSGLSVVDLLFNTGPESLLVLRKSIGMDQAEPPIGAPASCTAPNTSSAVVASRSLKGRPFAPPNPFFLQPPITH